MASADVHEDVKCSICLNFYTDPVTLNCGHNFCRDCIETYLDTKKENDEDYSCPQCRKRFRGRPSLQKNTDLSNIAEKMKSLAGQENRKCFEHDRILELYCTWDFTCICMLCKFDKHQGHEMENLEEASERKKNELRIDLQKLRDSREKIDKRVWKINQHEAKVTKHISEITEKVSKLFTETRNHLDDLEKRVRSELSRQAEQKDPISDLIHKLEVQKEELSRKIKRLEELSTADTITLLQDEESDGDNEYEVDLCSYKEREPDEFIISMMLHKGLSDMERLKNVLFPVLSEGTNITLYRNTAGDDVEISEDRKSAKSTNVKEKWPKLENTFKYGVVLSTGEFSSGKHYWMVEGSTSGEWGVGVCYSSISKNCGWMLYGHNFWGIRWCRGSYSVPYGGNHKPLNDTNSSNKVLVYLDYEAGRLSFYELYDPLRLLYTFTRKFTEPISVVLQVLKNNNKHGQITMLQKDAWCSPMLGPIPSI